MTQQEFNKLVNADIQRLVAKAQAEYEAKDAADPQAFYGFPTGSVSTSNVGGNDVTAGETAPIDPNQWAFDHGLEST